MGTGVERSHDGELQELPLSPEEGRLKGNMTIFRILTVDYEIKLFFVPSEVGREAMGESYEKFNFSSV